MTSLLRVYAIIPAPIPSVVISILRPLSALARRGEIDFKFDRSTHWSRVKIADADIVVFCRNNTCNDLAALIEAQRQGKPVIYDIDDDFFSIPLTLPVGRNLRFGLSLPIVQRFAETAAVVRAYSGVLRERLAGFGANITLIDSYFDETLVPSAEDPHDETVQRIVFASARDRIPESDDPAMAALARLVEHLKDKVEVHFFREPPPALRHNPRVRIHQPIANYTTFLTNLVALRPTIGIAPAADSVFFSGKTNNKYREYGGLGIPAIYSDVPLYRHDVTDGVTGLVVSNRERDWFAALLRLATDGQLRRDIARQAQADVRRRFSLDAFLSGWRDCFDAAMARKLTAPATSASMTMTLLGSQSSPGAEQVHVETYRDLIRSYDRGTAPAADNPNWMTDTGPVLVVAKDARPPMPAIASSSLIVDLCLCRDPAMVPAWCGALSEREQKATILLRPDQQRQIARDAVMSACLQRLTPVTLNDPRDVDSHFDLSGNASAQLAVVGSLMGSLPAQTGDAGRCAQDRPMSSSPRLLARGRDSARRLARAIVKVLTIASARSSAPPHLLLVTSLSSASPDEIREAVRALASVHAVVHQDAWRFLAGAAGPVPQEMLVVTEGPLPRVLAASVSAGIAGGVWLHIGPLAQADDDNFAAARNGFSLTRSDAPEAVEMLRSTQVRVALQAGSAGFSRPGRMLGVLVSALRRRCQQVLLLRRLRGAGGEGHGAS